MKIAIVCDRVYPFFKGGVEKRYWDITQKLIEMGHEIHFFTGQWPGMDKDMVVDGAFLHGVYKVKNFYVNGKKSIKESIIFSIKLFPVLMKADFDVMDVDQFPLLHIFPSKLVSILKQKRMILTWHEPWGKHWIEYIGFIGYIGMLIEFIVTKLPDKIISVSDETTEKLVRITKANINKIETITAGLDLIKINKTQPSDKKSDIIFVGRLLSHKNVELLIKSVSVLKEKYKKIKCIIIGNGPEKNSLIELSKNLNLEKNIEFLGNIDSSEKVFSLMKSSRVFVLPSTREGFGLVAIEANACGIPVITIEHPNNTARRLIDNEVNGFLINLEEHELANKVEMVWNTNGGMCIKCLEFASKFDLKVGAVKTESMYNKDDRM